MSLEVYDISKLQTIIIKQKDILFPYVSVRLYGDHHSVTLLPTDHVVLFIIFPYV